VCTSLHAQTAAGSPHPKDVPTSYAERQNPLAMIRGSRPPSGERCLI
jgi:hypothetical protein